MNNLPTISYTEFKKGLIYVDGFYDWPLSGTAMYQGKKVRFDCLREFHVGDWETGQLERRFGIYDLPPEEWVEFEERQADFCKYVGEHWCYVNGKRNSNDRRNVSECHKFYDKWQDRPKATMKEEWLIAIVDSSLDEEYDEQKSTH